MNDWIIRPIEATDNPAIADVIRTVMPEFGAVGPGYSINDAEVDDMFSAYAPARHRYYVLERDSRIYGGSGIGSLKGGDGTICELRKMYVLEDGRGGGNGRRMLDLCLEAAVEFGYRHCYLETLARMHKARKLYEQAGFEFTDEPLGDTGHGTCDRYMLKELL